MAEQVLPLPLDAPTQGTPGSPLYWYWDGLSTPAVAITVTSVATEALLTVYGDRQTLFWQDSAPIVVPLRLQVPYLLAVDSAGPYTVTMMSADTPAIPQDCGMTDETVDYGVVEPGVQVQLFEHRAVNGDKYWSDEMMAYVDQILPVDALSGVDTEGCPVVTVTLGESTYFWRIRDLLVIE